VNLTDETQTVKPLGDEFVSPTAAIQVYEYGQNLPADKRADFNRVIRSDQVVNAGGVPYVGGGVGGAPFAPVAAPSTVATNAGTLAGAKASATEGAKLKVRAVADLPEKLAAVTRFRNNIDELLKSPGFNTIYGLSGAVDPRNYTPGTDAANAKSLREQIGSESFSVAVQQLRGLGQLSNAEGQTLQKAYQAATDPKISDREARKRYAALRNELDAAYKRAEQRAGRGETVSEAQAPAGGPQPGTVEDGYRFKGGDPADPTNWEPVQ